MLNRLFRRPPAGERERRVLRAALDRLAQVEPGQRVEAMAALMAELRPRDAADSGTAERRVRTLTLLVSADELHRDVLRVCLLELLTDRRWVHLLTDTGVLSNEGLLTGLWRRLVQKMLPDVVNLERLSDVVGRLFPRDDDHVWVAGVADDVWVALLDEMDFGVEALAEGRNKILLQFLQALQVISYRIAALGLEPELVRNHPAVEKYESPFLMQSEEVRQFIRDRQQALAEKRAPTIDDKHLLVLIEQCDGIVAKVRQQAEKTGASISLTALLLRLTQNLRRMQTLLGLLEPRPAHELNGVRVGLFKQLVRAENLKGSLGDLWAQHVAVLAQRITGNAGRAGEHYVTSTRAEYYDLLRAALGAGFIVALMALYKLELGETLHAPLVGAFLYSMNYALGFVVIYLFGFTIATKQPAMTAAYLAHSMEGDGGRRQLDGLAELVVRVSRSQFIAIVGNVAMAFPVGLLLGAMIRVQAGEPVLEAARAHYLLGTLDPVRSLALFHAAIAGVWLFLSGLISGYYDNLCVYNRIPDRIRQLRWLRRIAGERGRERIAAYVGENLGGLAGNFFFGVMLGSTATLGFLVGLPLDIQHVAFATANFAYSLAALDFAVAPAALLNAAAGIALIGAVNLGVSFALALWVALRSRDVEFGAARRLVRMLGQRLLRAPLDYVRPPREPAPEAARPA